LFEVLCNLHLIFPPSACLFSTVSATFCLPCKRKPNVDCLHKHKKGKEGGINRLP